jgi:hypothetical protein
MLLLSKARFLGSANAIVGLRPVVFGPGTLWRTWGTRPIPSDLALTQTPQGLSFYIGFYTEWEARFKKLAE